MRFFPLRGEGEVSVQLDGQLTVAGSVQLDCENRLPAAQDQLTVLDQQRGEPRQQQLAAVRVAVDRLIEGDLPAAGKIVVLVPGVRRSYAFKQALNNS